MKIRLAFAVLVLSALACGTYVTPTPTITPTPPPSATAPPVATRAARVTATPQQAAEAETARVVVPVVNVRLSAGGIRTGEYVLAGQAVTILEHSKDGEWVRIEKPAGWIFLGCLSVESGLGCEAE